MTVKSVLISSALAIASLSIASAKSYEIYLSAPTKAANIQLDKGQYKMKVEGANAVFTNVDTGKKYTAPVKVENSAKKYDVTSVETTKQPSGDEIKSIDLGGSTTSVDFE